MNVGVDSNPLTDSIFDCNDYSGLQVHSLVHQPLAAFLPRESPESSLAIEIPSSLKWSDGQGITAVDYARGLEKALSPAASKFFLRGVRRIHAKDQTLTFEMPKPNHRLRDVLSMNKISPYREGLSSGAWVKVEANRYAPHPYNCSHDEELNLRLVDNPGENMALFESGALDFTADTAFPFDRELSDVHERSVGLNAALVFGETLAKSSALRLTIAELCNEISFESVTHGFCPRLPRPLMLAQKRVRSDVTLRLAYDAFYPNGQVCQLIARRLRAGGIKVELVVDDYYAPKQNFDLRFSILKSLGTSPYLFYLGQVFGSVLRANLELRKKYLALLAAQQERTQFTTINLDAFLAEHAVLVPLFEIKSLYRSRRACANPLLQHLVVS
jgi:hypothetical protein